eukprot:427840-Amphidinium_carterae.1
MNPAFEEHTLSFSDVKNLQRHPAGLSTTYVVVTMFVLYSECLLLYMLDCDFHKGHGSHGDTIYIVVLHLFLVLLLYSFAMACLAHPGPLPSHGWQLESDALALQVAKMERKKTGGPRTCKWCLVYKPDRAHHCRECNFCVLRLDHHCPWVYNCVGYRNHKYFLLVLFYATAELIMVITILAETLTINAASHQSISYFIFALHGVLTAAMLLLLVGGFLCFHLWLMFLAMTTLEFCEKACKNPRYDKKRYHQGLYSNVCAVLGPNPLFWLLPLSLPNGDGISWYPQAQQQVSKGRGEV